jgi:hypothetical protein
VFTNPHGMIGLLTLNLFRLWCLAPHPETSLCAVSDLSP